jgi:hypothetical protein
MVVVELLDELEGEFPSLAEARAEHQARPGLP